MAMRPISLCQCKTVGRKGYDSEVKKLRYEQDRFDSTGLSNCRWVLVLSCGTSGTCKRLDALDFQALPKL